MADLTAVPTAALLDELAAREERRILTERQREMLQLVADGDRSQIPARLYVTDSTVKATLGAACQRLGARSTTHAVLLALRLELIR